MGPKPIKTRFLKAIKKKKRKLHNFINKCLNDPTVRKREKKKVKNEKKKKKAHELLTLDL